MALPSTGRSTSVQLLLDGIAVAILSDCTEFSVSDTSDEIQTKYLGTDGSSVFAEFVDYNGTLKYTKNSDALDEFTTNIMSARSLQVPYLITLIVTTTYRDLSSTTFIYPNVEILKFESSDTRGSTIDYTMTWKSGSHRIAL